MSKKKSVQISDDIFSRLASEAPLTTKGFKSVDNYYFTDDFKKKSEDVDKYAVDDLKKSGQYYDESGNAVSAGNLDNASWYSKLFGNDTNGKLLNISEDILYPDGELLSNKLKKQYLSEGVNPDAAEGISQENARLQAKSKAEGIRQGTDVLGVIGMGAYANVFINSAIESKQLIPYFHPTLKKWVSKVASKEDFDAGAAAMSAYGPKSENDNFISAFNKGFSNSMASLPRSVARFGELTYDLSEILIKEDLGKLGLKHLGVKTAVHCPCSLQHAQQLGGHVEQILRQAGIELSRTQNGHLCCGSAGTYSILQPKMSQQLLSNKLSDLTIDNPKQIVTANIGCQLHLESRSTIPVKHWIELLDVS